MLRADNDALPSGSRLRFTLLLLFTLLSLAEPTRAAPTNLVWLDATGRPNASAHYALRLLADAGVDSSSPMARRRGTTELPNSPSRSRHWLLRQAQQPRYGRYSSASWAPPCGATCTTSTSAALSLVIPVAICSQNCRSTSRRSDGAPGDRIAPRPVNFCIHPAGRPISTSMIKVLRRPIESTQYTSIAFGNRCREMGVRLSMGTVGDAYDNAMAESFFATLEARTNCPTHLENKTRATPGHLQLDRELVQPAPKALCLELSLTQ